MMVSIKDRVRAAAGALALGLALSMAGAAGAQQPAAAPAPAPISPSALAAAREVVTASGMDRSFSPMVEDLTRQIVPSLTRTHPELTTDLTAVVAQLKPEFLTSADQMTDTAARIFAGKMSEDELKQTAAFFKSPAGAKYVSVQPAMLDELVVAMQSWTQELSNTMLKRVREEMVKKGHSVM